MSKYDDIPPKYPNLFDNRPEYCFDCGPGWYDLINELCAKIEAEIIAWKERNPDSKDSLIAVSQIKEKYGTLRFYMYSETDAISDMIWEAEEKSGLTCENCGKPGQTRWDCSWVHTTCDECEKK
jgi:hypothetical protein